MPQSLRNRKKNNPNTPTIYDGVPSYLNPKLMKQRENRSTSVKAREDNANDNKEADNLLTRSQSHRIERITPKIRLDPNHASINNDPQSADYPLMDLKRAKSNNNNNTKKKKKIIGNLKKDLLHRHSQTVPNKEEAFSSRRSYSYSDLAADPNRDRLRTEWSLYNDEPGEDFPNPRRKSTHQELTISYVKTAPQKR